MGFVLLIIFAFAAWGAFRLWQIYGLRAPVRDLELRREDLKDLSDEADLEDEIEEETAALRERGFDFEEETK